MRIEEVGEDCLLSSIDDKDEFEAYRWYGKAAEQVISLPQEIWIS